jgi:hypothetical protein
MFVESLVPLTRARSLVNPDKYCPTRDMNSDLLTLQGAAFRKLRALLLNLDSELSPLLAVAHRSVLELAHSRTTTGLNKRMATATQVADMSAQIQPARSKDL